MDIEALEALDDHATLRNALGLIADRRGDWAGIPMPISGQPLIVEPRYPKAAELMLIGRPEDPPEAADAEKWTRRNSFWSTRHRCRIHIWQSGERITWSFSPGVHHLDMDLRTLGASVAWGIAQEARAVDLLASLLSHYAFKCYLMTGTFLESSERSGLQYMFRRLKPTVVLTLREERARILCTLCMHPIAYYEGSWAGAMCPTDDVIAHLMLMRGDERMFWRRANQHPACVPEAGL